MCTVAVREESALSEAAVGAPFCVEVSVNVDVVACSARLAVLRLIVVSAPDASVTMVDTGKGAVAVAGPEVDVTGGEISGSESSLQFSNLA